MILINSIKKSFNCIVENPAIMLFLVLFMIGANTLAQYVLAARVPLVGQILILCLFVLIFAFFAGWFQVIKESSNREKIKEKNFYSIFLEGIGANIVSVSIGLIIYTIFMVITIALAQFVAFHYFGDINFFLNEFTKIAKEQGNLASYFSSLDVNQKYIIYGWNLCIILSIAIYNFVFTFYFPAILYNQKNIFLRPLCAIIDNFKFLFKNFFSIIALTVFIYLINAILTILNANFVQNAVISFLLLLTYIYFVSWVVMLIFNYYEAKNNSSNGCNSIGENEACNSISKED